MAIDLDICEKKTLAKQMDLISNHLDIMNDFINDAYQFDDYLAVYKTVLNSYHFVCLNDNSG